MTAAEAIAHNLAEVRRRSMKVWTAIPDDKLAWKPDPEAMSCIQHVRHLLEADYLWRRMVETRKSVGDEDTPFTGRPLETLGAELAFGARFHDELLSLVLSLTDEDLTSIRVDRSDRGYTRAAGDFLLRAAYHEAVHTGQLLAYFRAMGVARPSVWD